MEAVSGALAGLLEAMAHRGDPLVPGVGATGAVVRGAAHSQEPAAASGHPLAPSGDPAPGAAAGAAPSPSDGRLHADLVDLGHGEPSGLVLYGPPAAAGARSVPEPGVAAERLHQLLLLMGAADGDAGAARPGVPGAGLATTAAATGTANATATVAPTTDPTTLALAAALVATPALADSPPVDRATRRRRPDRPDRDDASEDEGADHDGDRGSADDEPPPEG
jgi:hypothetical protein